MKRERGDLIVNRADRRLGMATVLLDLNLLEGAHPRFDPQQQLSERGAGTPSAHNMKMNTSISNDHAENAHRSEAFRLQLGTLLVASHSWD